MSKKKIVVGGGGNGSAITLRALKTYREQLQISSMISMSDSGGSSGRLREEFTMLPPGDILRAVLASSPHDYDLLRDIFRNKRFKDAGDLTKHNLGNMFVALATQYLKGDMVTVLRALEQAVDATATAHPVTMEQSNFCVELSNGEIVIGEAEIDDPAYDRAHTISRAWLQPTPAINPAVREAIEEADVMVLGPGSLYTSIVATLCVEGMVEAIRASKAKIVYVVGNAYELDGETGPTKMSEFVLQLQQYIPRKIDLVVYCDSPLTDAQKKKYEKRRWGLFEQDVAVLEKEGYGLLSGSFEKGEGGLDPEALGKLLITHI